MATNTTNYGWTKPSYEDAADIEVINGTIDNIDAQVKTNENNISAVTMGTQSTGDIDLNAVTTNSYKMYTNTTSNLPTSDGSWYFVKTTVFDNNTILQEATAMNAGAKTYTRIKRSGNWQAWKLSNLDSTQEAAVNSGITSTDVAQIETNKNNISSIGAIIGKQVYSAFLGQDSGTAAYQMKTADFQTDTPNAQQCGIYIVYVISWSTTPVVSIYTVGYSGGTAGYNVVTKIVGTDSLISVDENRKITYTGKGKISIYAMR